MLTCLPQSICSWDFTIPNTSSGLASIAFNFFTEQGSISLGGIDYAVRKHGPLSGHWTLESAGQPIADAHKPNPLFRAFELTADGFQVSVKALSPFTRAFGIYSGGQQLGLISPAHPFTRRATIDCVADVPEICQLFAFWLAVLAWRRQARSNAGNASAGR
jgi:hypothetical protein